VKLAAALESRGGANTQPAVVPNAPLPGAIVSLDLYFDTTYVGYARSIDGCTRAFDVIQTVERGVAKEVSKSPHVEPCILQHGLMPNAFESWILDQVNNSAILNPDSLGIVGIDVNGTPVAAVRVIRPLLIGFSVPAGDAGGAGAGFFYSMIDGTLVETVKPSAYSGGTKTASPGLSVAEFQLSISGVGVPSATRVSSIELNRSDLDRDNPGPWDVSNVQVETLLSKPGPFMKWWASVLSDGSGAPERSLSLAFLNARLAPNFEIDLDGVGMYRADSGVHGGRRNFSLYAETPTVVFP
jgi:hypothetical protein